MKKHPNKPQPAVSASGAPARPFRHPIAAALLLACLLLALFPAEPKADSVIGSKTFLEYLGLADRGSAWTQYVRKYSAESPKNGWFMGTPYTNTTSAVMPGSDISTSGYRYGWFVASSRGGNRDRINLSFPYEYQGCMNCTGFGTDLFSRFGEEQGKNVDPYLPGTNHTGSPGYPEFGAFAWYEFLEGGSRAGRVKVYSFTGANSGTPAGNWEDGVQKMLDSGVLEYGDIIYSQARSFAAGDEGTYSGNLDSHWGLYVGDGKTNLYWHSAYPNNLISKTRGLLENFDRNVITEIRPKYALVTWHVIKVGGKDMSSLAVKKTSSEPDLVSGSALYSLKGAVYGVYRTQEEARAATAEKPGKPVATLTTKKDGSTERIEIDEGTWWIRELTPSPGHELCSDSSAHIHKLSAKAGTDHTVTCTEPALFDALALSVEKQDLESGLSSPYPGASLDGAEYTVRYYDGYYDRETLPASPRRTWILRTKTDGASSKSIAALSEEYLAGGDPLWKSTSGDVILPLGTVTVEETKAPPGYQITDRWVAEDGTVSEGLCVMEIRADGNGASLRGSRHLTNADRPVPSLATSAADSATGDRVSGCDGVVTLTDTVTYDHLLFREDAPVTYRIRGTLYDKSTGEPLMISPASDEGAGGICVTGESGPITVSSPDEIRGLAVLSFTFDASQCAGSDLVVFEDLCYEDCTPVAVQTAAGAPAEPVCHHDLNDEGQTVHFPSVRTEAAAGDTQDHIGLAEGTVTVTDLVRYTHLLPEREYVLRGTLIDRETLQPCAEAETTFLPEEADGEVQLVFSFPAEASGGEALAGRSLVAFEELFYRDVRVAVHADPQDAAQTVVYPSLATYACAGSTLCHEAVPAEEEVITDEVRYGNLLPGRTYRIRGTLMRRSDGRPLAVPGEDGSSAPCVVYSEPFTVPADDPAAASGSAQLSFAISSSDLTGETLTVCEELLLLPENDAEKEPAVVAKHCDIEDEEQSVHFIAIGTSAFGRDSGAHEEAAASSAVITDRVYFRNLVPLREYRLNGTLCRKETGEPLDDPGASATVLFSPVRADGYADVTFTIDASKLAGDSVVAVEDLLVDGTVIASHRDLSDPDQTVRFVSIRTSASDKETGAKTLGGNGMRQLKDVVFYEGLTEGEPYLLFGSLADRESGELLGNTVEHHFTASASGQTEVLFTVDASKYAGRSIVVFEELYDADYHRIAVHSDPHNDEQTVSVPVPVIKVTRTAVKTGDGSPVVPMTVLLLSAGGGTAVVAVLSLRIRKKRRKGAGKQAPPKVF